MKTICLTKGQIALVDDDDFLLVKQYRWCASRTRETDTYYAYTKAKGKTLYMHRLILGETNSNIDIDHINHNGCDNRRKNIHTATGTFNAFQKRKQKLHLGKKLYSKYKGVTWFKSRAIWMAQTEHNKRHFNLGYYTDEIDAARAYDKKVIEILSLDKALLGCCLNLKSEWINRCKRKECT